MELTYHVVLRTRSTDRDYFWVGNDPDEWWRRWGDSKLRRQPTYVREVSATGDRLFLTGVVSGRRDGSSSHTAIRYEIAAQRATDGLGMSAAQITGLIDAWWNQRLTATQTSWQLGLEIDTVLTDQAVAEQLSIDALLENRDEAQVESALRRLAWSGSPVTSPPAVPAGWIGADHPDVAELLHGSRSIAYFAGVGPTEAVSDLGLPSDVLLVVDGDRDIHPQAAVKAHRPKDHAARSPRVLNSHQFRLWTLLILGILILAAALFIL